MAESLESVFAAVAFKTLADVDLPGHTSHQHEINGVAALRDFFGVDTPVEGQISWHYFSDDADPLRAHSQFKFYDARAKTAAQTGRTEWRLYYRGDFLSCAKLGDILILARTKTGVLFGLVFQQGSSWLRSAQDLLKHRDFGQQLELFSSDDLRHRELAFLERQVLEELGLYVLVPESSQDEAVARTTLDEAIASGTPFPTTRRMSELAQSLVHTDFRDDDATLISFLDQEERLFRAIERIVVGTRLKQDFSSVDDFMQYSLSVQNRRKARMGLALQNHLARIFTEHHLRFKPQPTTEGKSRPDFLFPGETEYHNPNFDANLLVMLAAKSSCKERWRQVLDEAERIPQKHLCTLEPAISVDQTDAMKNRLITLVVPRGFHEAYTTQQQKELWSVGQFVEYVRSKQTGD